ncbi:MAG: hypothetical protein Q4D20_07865, partial [Clostridia bacterium]|nr:hypothetical protein [Clostridia bacterium]
STIIVLFREFQTTAKSTPAERSDVNLKMKRAVKEPTRSSTERDETFVSFTASIRQKTVFMLLLG